MKVLVIEDSDAMQRSLHYGLRRSGFAVDVAADGEEGLAYARHGAYDVIVLDLMLPGIDGLEVLRRLREGGGDTHVLILSAKDQVRERIEGLQLGADDYMTKPFAFDELVARLQALVRRKYGAKDPIQRVGPLELDTARRTASCADRALTLTPYEYAVLEHLICRRGRVVSKEELLEHIHDGDAEGSLNAVEVLIHQLRRKLGTPGLIQTRRGHGYLVE